MHTWSNCLLNMKQLFHFAFCINWWVNKVSHKFCPETEAVPFFIAVVALTESKNSWILVFASFDMKSLKMLSKVDGLKHSVDSRQLATTVEIPLCINLKVSCTRDFPYLWNPFSLQAIFTVASTSYKNGISSSWGKYINSLSWYFKYLEPLFSLSFVFSACNMNLLRYIFLMLG